MSTKSTLITIVIILVIVFAVWYISFLFTGKSQQSYNVQQGAKYINDTTARISSDLNQMPDDSYANNEANALNQSLQGF